MLPTRPVAWHGGSYRAPSDHPATLYALRWRRAFCRERIGSAARARRRYFALYAAVAEHPPPAHRAGAVQPVLYRPSVARLELRPRGVRCRRKKGAGVGTVARAPALLRHLSRGRRIASGLARRASALRIGFQALADRVELLPSISARRRAPAVRKSLAARGHLQFKDGPRRDSRALRVEPREAAGDL